ncbi:conserved Plasmodium protein, unknown function [Plasmodium ovale curtisi]|uniref:Uncharacterized protein n=1 Tax=Plasmodium ovale curtisi TaxID=864141 RepID=A0A1A8WFI6_PLAOA|nr:conserved Plasmodium protein, unknown function [Plasmodium ovale curtisi]
MRIHTRNYRAFSPIILFMFSFREAKQVQPKKRRISQEKKSEMAIPLLSTEKCLSSCLIHQNQAITHTILPFSSHVHTEQGNLQILSFKREDVGSVQENVEIHLNKSEIDELGEVLMGGIQSCSCAQQHTCDYFITSKMYLLKLSTEDIKRFHIHRYPFQNKQRPSSVPLGYEYAEKSLSREENYQFRYLTFVVTPFLPPLSSFPLSAMIITYTSYFIENVLFGKGEIHPSSYLLKISVEVPKDGLSPEGTWIFAITEKRDSSSGTQECTVYSDDLAQLFLQFTTSTNSFLLYCTSATNGELLNLAPIFRRTFNIELSTSKVFFGAHSVVYTIQMNLHQISPNLKADKVMVSIKMPIDLCYGNSCFGKHADNPCLNLKENPFDECTYTFRSHEFLLKSKRPEDVGRRVTVHIENLINPPFDLESSKLWEVMVYVEDRTHLAITREHRDILEKVSHDVCSKKFLAKLMNQYGDRRAWTKSHMASAPTPVLVALGVEAIQQHELLENPRVMQLKLLLPGGHIFNRCMIELKSIHRFTSVVTKSENRLDVHTYNLMLPNSMFKPVEGDEHSIIIDAPSVKNDYIVKFAVDIKKYKNGEYWTINLTCEDVDGKYVREAQSRFLLPINNSKIYVSDIYYREKTGEKKYLFYLNVFIYSEKEVEIKVSIESTTSKSEIGISSKKIQLSKPCDVAMYTSCYNLVFHECQEKESTILYKVNSYRSSNKSFTLFFPLIISKDVENFNLLVDVESKNNIEHVKKNIKVNINHIEQNRGKIPCISNLITILKKYNHYESHMFLLFKAVNCYNTYEPFLVNINNYESFIAKVDPLYENEIFSFQKVYRYIYPSKNKTISQNLFKLNIVNIITIILMDDTFFTNDSIKNVKDIKKDLLFFFHNNMFTYQNSYYFVNYTGNNVLIYLCKYIHSGKVKIDIVKKSSGILTLRSALDIIITFADEIKTKEKNFLYTEYSIMVLTDKHGIDLLKSNTSIYQNKNLLNDIVNHGDVNYNFVEKDPPRVYVVSFYSGEYNKQEENPFQESIAHTREIYTYKTENGKDDFLFLSFHKYIVDENLVIHYTKSIVHDYIILHTQLYRTSWYLIGICRHNTVKNSNTNRTLHLYYVDKLVKKVNYTISPEEARLMLCHNATREWHSVHFFVGKGEKPFYLFEEGREETSPLQLKIFMSLCKEDISAQ